MGISLCGFVYVLSLVIVRVGLLSARLAPPERACSHHCTEVDREQVDREQAGGENLCEMAENIAIPNGAASNSEDMDTEKVADGSCDEAAMSQEEEEEEEETAEDMDVTPSQSREVGAVTPEVGAVTPEVGAVTPEVGVVSMTQLEVGGCVAETPDVGTAEVEGNDERGGGVSQESGNGDLGEARVEGSGTAEELTTVGRGGEEVPPTSGGEVEAGGTSIGEPGQKMVDADTDDATSDTNVLPVVAIIEPQRDVEGEGTGTLGEPRQDTGKTGVERPVVVDTGKTGVELRAGGPVVGVDTLKTEGGTDETTTTPAAKGSPERAEGSPEMAEGSPEMPLPAGPAVDPESSTLPVAEPVEGEAGLLTYGEDVDVGLGLMGDLSFEEEEEPEEEVPEFPKTLEGLKYRFNEEGELRHTESDEPFAFVVKEGWKQYNQRHYEAVGEVITEEVYSLLEARGNLKRHYLPVDPSKEEPKSFFFMSEGAMENPDKLLILIHGSGVVRAGQWARSLIINHSINSGTQLPYIERGIREGYGIVVLNTNLNYEGRQPIRGNGTPQEHASYVWKNFIAGSKAKRIDIVAHSFGGIVTVDLMCEAFLDFSRKVHKIAFTDSVHSLYSHRVTRGMKKWIIKNTRNWVSSQDELDTPQVSYYFDGGEDVPRVSAGTQKHVETSWRAFESVFKYFAGDGKPE